MFQLDNATCILAMQCSSQKFLKERECVCVGGGGKKLFAFMLLLLLLPHGSPKGNNKRCPRVQKMSRDATSKQNLARLRLSSAANP